MYETHFQLRQAPFSIAPDPEFLYLSEGHREALAHLTYGLTQGGFVLITGEVGTGKTTLLRNLLRQMPPDIDVAFILNPRLTVRELLETICDELGIDYARTDRSSIKNYVDALSAHLLRTHAAGRSTLLIIDEAQNLAPAVLEQIRLLTNLETDKRKLLRIILLGQPELLELLARKELRQLAQRITARYHLRGLQREDTFAYVIHRLQRAGGSALIFTRPALARLHRISGGIPRLINLIADRALLGTYAAGRHRVTWAMVGRASREVLGMRPRPRHWLAGAAATAVLAALAVGYALFGERLLAPGESAADTAAAVTEPVRRESAAPGAADSAELRAPPTDDPGPAASVDAGVTPGAEAPVPTTAASQAEVATGSTPVLQATADSSAAGSADQMSAPFPVDATGAQRTIPSDAAAPTARLTRPEMTTFQSQRLAYGAAFARWGADFGSASLDVIPCDFAPTAGLQCLGGSGTWSDLRSLDLPAVLELWDSGSTPFYGALTAMSGDRVTLDVGGTAQQFDLRDLADHWFGGYVLLWKMPPGYAGTLKQGDRHSSVAWLRKQMEALGLMATGSATMEADLDLFDPGLREAVVRLQQSQGMQPDGVVGPLTWIRLAQRIGLEQPSLGD